jgi:hypothetical protein
VARVGGDDWVNTFVPQGDQSNADVVALAISPVGEVWLFGETNTSLELPDGSTLARDGPSDVVLGRISLDGTFLTAWQPFGGTNSEHATGFALDDDGSVVLAGWFNGELTDLGLTAPAGESDAFLAIFPPTEGSAATCARDVATSGSARALALAVFQGEAALVGDFDGAIDIDGTMYDAFGTLGTVDGFFAAYGL